MFSTIDVKSEQDEFCLNKTLPANKAYLQNIHPTNANANDTPSSVHQHFLATMAAAASYPSLCPSSSFCTPQMFLQQQQFQLQQHSQQSNSLLKSYQGIPPPSITELQHNFSIYNPSQLNANIGISNIPWQYSNAFFNHTSKFQDSSNQLTDNQCYFNPQNFGVYDAVNMCGVFNDNKENIYCPKVFPQIIKMGSDEDCNHPKDGILQQDKVTTPKQGKRTLFDFRQVNELERAFSQCDFIKPSERVRLAEKINLTSDQVKIWFQNRRYKAKKAKKDEEYSRNNPHIYGNIRR